MDKYLVQRKIDELGRIVLPIDVRKALDLHAGDSVDIGWEEPSKIVSLQKSNPSCLNCHSQEDLKALPGGKYICRRCLSQVK